MEWIWPFQDLNNGVHDFYETSPVQRPNVGFGFFGGCFVFRVFFWGFGLVLVCLGFLSVKMHRPFMNIFHEANVVI